MNIIKIMPSVEGDRSDCQPEASSIAQSRSLRAVAIVEVWQSDLSPSTQGMIVSLSFTHLVYPCTLGPFVKRKEVEHELVQGFCKNSLPCKQMATLSPLLLVSAQLSFSSE